MSRSSATQGRFDAGGVPVAQRVVAFPDNPSYVSAAFLEISGPSISRFTTDATIVDDISFAPVPLAAAAWMLLAGPGALIAAAGWRN